MRWILLLVLAGCTPKPVISSVDSRTVAVTVETWRELGLPYSRKSCGFLDNVSVIDVRDNDTYLRYCMANLPGYDYKGYRQASSCYDYRSTHIVLSPVINDSNRSSAVTHEMVHALQGCRKDRDAIDWFDANHSIPELWGPDGVEKRTIRKLRGEEP